MKDFFISYNKADKQWAEWIAWQLDEAGYSLIFQEWDFRPGANFVWEMQKATAETTRTIAVLSPDYLSALYTHSEWAAAFAADPLGQKQTLLPIVVRECELKGLLRQIVHIELTGLNEEAAKAQLLQGAQQSRSKPPVPPKFPASTEKVKSSPAFPNSISRVWSVPHLRNPNFTGREAMLAKLRDALTSDHSAALTQAIHGLGGVGKTQLALEYAYRYANEYDAVWWLRAEKSETLSADYAALAKPLNLLEKYGDKDEGIRAVKQWLDHNIGWLLIFDNAQSLFQIYGYLPQSNMGHVLVTSRNPDWEGIASSFKVVVFDFNESMKYLCMRTGQNDWNTAKALAEELGHLPLALAQAASYIISVESSLADYLALYRQHRHKLLAKGKASVDYPHTVATTWEISFQHIKQQSQHAADLLNLCAFLPPDNINRHDLAQGLKGLNDLNSLSLRDPLMFDDAIATLKQYSLIDLKKDTFLIHRLVQAIAKDRMSKSEQKLWFVIATRLRPNVDAEWFASRREMVRIYLYKKWHIEGPDLEDLVQATMLAAVKRSLNLKGMGEPENTLLSVAKNFAEAYFRKRGRHVGQPFPLELAESIGEIFHEQFEASELSRLLKEKFVLLPTKYIKVLQLAFYKGYTEGEIAKNMAIPVVKVHNYKSDGLKRLRKLCKKDPILRFLFDDKAGKKHLSAQE